MSYFTLLNKIEGFTYGDRMFISVGKQRAELSEHEVSMLVKMIKNTAKDFGKRKKEPKDADR